MLWFILLLPLLSFALTGLFLTRRAGWSALLSVGSAIMNAGIAFWAVNHPALAAPVPLTWLNLGAGRTIEIGIIWDGLAQLMTLVVTGVGALIHIYSLGYMKEDPGKGRFFAFLSLFMFSMLGIVLASNFVMMFIFWELVGLSSYLLIGFWYEKPSAAEAGKKALIVNKLGDVGFLLGIIMVWTFLGAVDFQAIKQNLTQHLEFFSPLPGFSARMADLAILLLFCGVLGKSAQIPLHVWLPDAMEGPTPVSALIHAATMVAAGVYMLCRIFFVLQLAPSAMLVMAWVGGLTSLFAALWAVAQDDIKRVLAYSTMSQLGLMVMAVGLSAPGAAMFHLATHAFFKALLFLGAGSVLMALHHEQNIWKMGGLRERMPITFLTFLIGMLALCGVVGFSGYYSKDQILMAAWSGNRPLFVVGFGASFLTSFYMGRMFIAAFLGRPKSSTVEHAHENGWVIALPLLLLGIASIGAGWKWVGIQSFLDFSQPAGEEVAGGGAALLLTLLPFVGLGLAWWVYSKAESTDPLRAQTQPLWNLLASKFGFDEFYDGIVRWVQGSLTEVLDWFDRWIVDYFFVKGTSLGVLCFGNLLRCFQTGNLQTYLVYFGIGLVSLLYWLLK